MEMQSKASETSKFIKKSLDQLHSLEPKKTSFFKSDPEIEINGKSYYFASLNKRLLASTLDVVIISILLMPLSLVFSAFDKEIFKVQIKPEYLLEKSSVSSVFNILLESGMLWNIVAVQLCVFLMVAVYMVLFWHSNKMSTPGKMFFRCVVLDIKTGEKLSFKKSIIRFISIPLSLLSLMIGLFMIDWTKNRQALHDKIAGSVVVYTKKQ